MGTKLPHWSYVRIHYYLAKHALTLKQYNPESNSVINSRFQIPDSRFQCQCQCQVPVPVPVPVPE